MWIALTIIGFLATLITVILLLPVKILIRNDENGELMLRYKFLFKTYGEDPDPNAPLIKILKTAVGADRLSGKSVQESIRKDGLKRTVKDTYRLLINLLKEIVELLQYGTITRLHVEIRCTGDGADEAAIQYGQYCTATYGLLNALRSFLKVRKQGCKIDISCDFLGEESVFNYDVVLAIRFGRVLAGFWKVALAEARRMGTQKGDQRK